MKQSEIDKVCKEMGRHFPLLPSLLSAIADLLSNGRADLAKMAVEVFSDRVCACITSCLHNAAECRAYKLDASNWTYSADRFQSAANQALASRGGARLELIARLGGPSEDIVKDINYIIETPNSKAPNGVKGSDLQRWFLEYVLSIART